LALEYVQGVPIDVHARAQRLSLAARVDLLLQVAEAVAYAHRRLVVHRDLKPSNILVTADGQVRLLDFGIARLLDADGRTGGAEATLAAPALTPGYASPEQLQGAPLSTATDVYSLGVVAHQLLVGARPFDHLDAQGLARVQAIVGSDPPRPSSRVMNAAVDPAAAAVAAAVATERSLTPAALRRALAGDLDAILLRALAREPQARYPSVEALADDLARWRGGRPVSAQPPRAGYLLRKFVLRHRLAVAAGSLAALALAVTASVAVVLGLQAREQAQRAQAARDFLVGLFERADPDLRSGRDATARELLAQSEQDIARLPVAQQRELLRLVADLWLHFGDPAQALRQQARLSALYERAGDAAALSAARLREAQFALQLGDIPQAAARLDAAEAAWPLSRWPAGLRARAQYQRAVVSLWRGQTPAALAQLAAADADAQSAGDLSLRLQLLPAQSAALLTAGDDAAAARVQHTLQQLIDSAAAQPLPRRERAHAREALARQLLDGARLREAGPVLDRAVQEADALYGAAAGAQLRIREPWLRQLIATGQTARAVTWLQARPVDDAEIARYGAGTAVYWHVTVAELWAHAAQPAAAQQALAAARSHLATLPADEAAAAANELRLTEAVVLLLAGDAARALAVLQAADARSTLRLLLQAAAQAAQGRDDEALESLDAALALPPPRRRDRALVQLNRTIVELRRAGRASEALRAQAGALAATLQDTDGADAPTARAAARLQATGPSPAEAQRTLADLRALRPSASTPLFF
ncbi:MAG: serine/threonine protein kinase, partial [Burkholderiaceae bacterium]|nr:serine/threonine protein kinase [Burkholderiaceae bacterium]